MKQKVLMTGITGVLGTAIFSGLEDIYDVYYLVRDGIYNKQLSLEIDQSKVFDSDITKELCGLSLGDIQRLRDIGIDKFLHIAANVSFEIEDNDGKIWTTNHTGTSHAIALAKHLDIREFLFCSTAFAEDARNPYEQSKLAAEKLVKKSGLKFSIFRPSAIVGDSITGYTAYYNGYYGAFAYLNVLANRFKELFSIYIICGEEATLNLISLDWISYTLLHLLQKPVRNEIYYLTHDQPKPAKWILERTFEILKISGVKYLEPLKDLFSESGYDSIAMKMHNGNAQTSRIQKMVNPILDRYHPYVTFERSFPLDTVKEALGEEFIQPPPIDVHFLEIILRYAVEENFGYGRVKK